MESIEYTLHNVANRFLVILARVICVTQGRSWSGNWGVGGCIFISSGSVIPFEVRFDFKEIGRAEHEYMSMQTICTPSRPQVNALRLCPVTTFVLYV